MNFTIIYETDDYMVLDNGMEFLSLKKIKTVDQCKTNYIENKKRKSQMIFDINKLQRREK